MKKVKTMKNNYKIYVDEKNKTVIAVCRYAGRNVRAVAKCAPEDTFNVEFGTKLAKARCDVKVAKAKIQNASVAYMKASIAADEAQRQYDKMKNYYMDSVDQFDKASAAVVNLIKEIM